MSRVKSFDTSIEVTLRSALHRRGLRFQKHVRKLPGKPDVVFTRAKIAIFVDGDFWHGYRFRKWEGKLTPFWRDKIVTNRARDCRNFKALRKKGWKVIRVWEHEVKSDLSGVVERIERTWKARVSDRCRADGMDATMVIASSSPSSP